MELIPYLTIVFMLQFINWTLEAVKLKILLPHDKLNFQHILKSIYVGNLTALLTPKITLSQLHFVETSSSSLQPF
jgi:hypothetical protein